ncbi:MAG: hypothetical protein ACRD3J_11165 [Thermoanaerobaculia bacterium]
MTRNRKADLQRKLAMAPVATPPAGLADRIKSDIPRNLGFESERARTRTSALSNLRIAASIILLVSGTYFALHFLSRTDLNRTPATSVAESKPASEPRAAIAMPTTPPEPGSAREQPRTDLPPMPTAPPARVAPVQSARISEAKREEAARMSAGAPSLVDTRDRETAADGRIAAANEALPLPAPPPPAPASQAQAAPMAGVVGGTLQKERQVTAKTSALSYDAAPERDFVAIQEAIVNGETPRLSDTSAIVQHFASPERTPAHLRIEIEASGAPLDPTKWLLRVSIDAPASSWTDVDLVFGEAVASHHPLTGSPAVNETALYDIEFKPHAERNQIIATVKAGKSEETIRVSDLLRWDAASTRMKRASLAAAWARMLQARTKADAVVAKAREAHIDDLADMAERAERNQ